MSAVRGIIERAACQVASAPILAVSVALLSAYGVAFPALPAGSVMAAAGGAAAYAALHAVRPPRKTYVWGHEISHAAAAFLTGRKVLDFHVFGEGAGCGGFVVSSGGSAPSLALFPYALPFWPFVVLAVSSAVSAVFAHVPPPAYAAAAAFACVLHVFFTVESFAAAQPDLFLYGRVFSFSVTAVSWVLCAPALAFPASATPMSHVPSAYAKWLIASAGNVRSFLWGG